MKRLARCSMAALVLMLFVKFPAPAQERETEAEKVKEAQGVTEKGPNVFWGWINFALLAGGLGYVIKKNAGPYFAQRSLEIRKGMADAEAARAASDAKVAEVDRRLANLQAEIEALRHGAQQEAKPTRNASGAMRPSKLPKFNRTSSTRSRRPPNRPLWSSAATPPIWPWLWPNKISPRECRRKRRTAWSGALWRPWRTRRRPKLPAFRATRI